jgi:hypothetical protein
MLEELHPKYATKVTHHKQRIKRDLIHHEHVPSKAASARGARESLHSCYDLIGTKAAELHNLYRRPERSLTKAGITLCFSAISAADSARIDLEHSAARIAFMDN